VLSRRVNRVSRGVSPPGTVEGKAAIRTKKTMGVRALQTNDGALKDGGAGNEKTKEMA